MSAGIAWLFRIFAVAAIRVLAMCSDLAWCYVRTILQSTAWLYWNEKDWKKQRDSMFLTNTVLPDIRNNTALFEIFKDFPACPSDKHSINLFTFLMRIFNRFIESGVGLKNWAPLKGCERDSEFKEIRIKKCQN